jgi:hypothetical protein
MTLTISGVLVTSCLGQTLRLTEPNPDFDSPGDEIARNEGDDEGGTAVREPRRPKPYGPLAGAAAVEPSISDESAERGATDE